MHPCRDHGGVPLPIQFVSVPRLLLAALMFALASCNGDGNSSSPAGSPMSGGSPTPVANYSLSVSTSGSGTVASNPSGISCGSACSASYASGTNVTLTAAPATGYSFSGWGGGACSGTGNCIVSMTAARSVSATFTPSTGGGNGGPQLLFSDLVSGPNAGNSDTTHGTGGAIVSIWGRRLGPSQGASVVRIGGVVAPVYEWKNASGPAADMYTRHGMQTISFLVPSTVPVGNQNIQVTVNNVTSNTLPFTVRSQGNIYYVQTTGNDSNNGSWSAPWQTIPKATNSIANGDIIYVGDGVTQTTRGDFGAHGCVNLGQDGAASLPHALVAYPGATVNVGGAGATCDDPFSNFNTGTGNLSSYWIVSKMRALGVGRDNSGMSAYTGYRLVGNFIRIPFPNDNCQSGMIGGQGNNFVILGNQITNTAIDNPTTVSKLCHTIYLSGKRSSSTATDTCGGVRCPTESNREVGWNLLNDNYDNRGINIYSEQDRSAFLEGHRVHDNYIINHRGDGILIGYYVTGENWFYNNVLINTGLGPDWTGGELSGHYALQINGGHESGRPTTLHVWNNSIYGGGYAVDRTPLLTFYRVNANITGVNLDFLNNVIVSPNVPYWNNDAGLVPLDGTAPNLWFGQGAAPSWNTGGIVADPMFVNTANGDLHLLSGSPAIDRGSSGVGTVVTTDYDGVPRPQGAGFDIGAYEQ